jgi:hypothetical protein
VASITGCTFGHNQAIGGNGNTGSGPVVLVGEGLGGAIVSGYGGPDSVNGPNTLTVSNSTFSQNAAQGGDNNSGTASLAALIGTGTGAGIANYAGGTASISGSVLDRNQAIGGRHNTAGGTGAVFAGLGAGGTIFNYLGNYTSPDADFGPLGPFFVNLAQGSAMQRIFTDEDDRKSLFVSSRDYASKLYLWLFGLLAETIQQPVRRADDQTTAGNRRRRRDALA